MTKSPKTEPVKWPLSTKVGIYYDGTIATMSNGEPILFKRGSRGSSYIKFIPVLIVPPGYRVVKIKKGRKK